MWCVATLAWFSGTSLCAVYQIWCVEQIKPENKNDYVDVDVPDRQLRQLCLSCH